MRNQKLYSININSLNILDVLLKERNLTATGKKLNLSQSTISSTLKYLREVFEDDLLIKSLNSKQMALTPLASSIKDSLGRVIKDLENVIFNPVQQQQLFSRTLKLALSDTILVIFVPELIKRLKKTFPNIRLEVFDLNLNDYVDQLNEGYLDIAAGVVIPQAEQNTIYCQYLMKDHIVCAGRKGHPALTKKIITLEEYKRYPRVMIKYVKSPYDITNETDFEGGNISLDAINLEGTLPIHNTFGMLPVILETNRLVLTSRLLMMRVSKYVDIQYITPKFKVSPVEYTICCSKHHKDDLVIKAVINIFSEIAKEVADSLK